MSIPFANKHPTLSSHFQASSGSTKKGKRPPPFSFRLTPEERAYLKQQAGNKPLGSYIREKLLGDKASARKVRNSPAMDQKQYAELLAALGQSHLSNNLNQLAKHANMGSLDVSDDVEQQLQDAYAAVMAMRAALFMALGIKSGGSS